MATDDQSTLPTRGETAYPESTSGQTGDNGQMLPVCPEVTAAPSKALPFFVSLHDLLHIQQRPLSYNKLIAGLSCGTKTPALADCLQATVAAGVQANIFVQADLNSIPSVTLPCILLLATPAGEAPATCVLTALDHKNACAEVMFPDTQGQRASVALDTLRQSYTGQLLLVSAPAKVDPRTASMHILKPQHWFWGVLRQYIPIYRDVALASFVINMLILASPLFIMNVYDRVVPNQTIYTLWVLFAGLLLAYCMDFVLRNLRSYYLDLIGRNADVIMGSRLMDRILHMRLANKPESLGGLVNNLREFEQVREFFSSTTLVAFFDIPFLVLFLILIGFIGGPIVFLLLASIPLMLLLIALVNMPFQRSVEQQLKQNMQKNALLVEIVSGLETVKSLLAQGHMRRQWETVIDASAQESGRSRLLANFASTGSLFITSIINGLIIVWGVYRIADGQMTQGGLIACVILGGRAVTPLMQIATMLSQLQKSRIAFRALDIIMQLPSERLEAQAIESQGLAMSLGLHSVSFQYPSNPKPALQQASLLISAGEKIGFVGNAGSGKSTLARLYSGLYTPLAGSVSLGGVDIRQIDPDDLRQRIGFMPQDNYLFYGTIRDNIALGCPWLDTKSLIHAAELAGVSSFVRSHPHGYDMQVGERGQSLSGGQRQMVALARTLARDPEILILDEPSSNLDMDAEQALMLRLRSYVHDKTLLIMTHRPSLLALVNRIVVLHEGRILADGPRDAVLQALQNGKIQRGQS